jgi:hypothetical protein
LILFAATSSASTSSFFTSFSFVAFSFSFSSSFIVSLGFSVELPAALRSECDLILSIAALIRLDASFHELSPLAAASSASLIAAFALSAADLSAACFAFSSSADLSAATFAAASAESFSESLVGAAAAVASVGLPPSAFAPSGIVTLPTVALLVELPALGAAAALALSALALSAALLLLLQQQQQHAGTQFWWKWS